MVCIGVLVGAITAVIAYFVPWLPDQAAEEAGPIDNLYWFVTIICIAIFALVAGVSIYSVFKFRAAPDDEEDGSPIHGHTGLEIVWTAVPAALVTAISVYSGVVLTQIEDIPKDHRVVEVTAQQFAWSFHYPDLEITSGELALPTGEAVELKLTSRDVIHAFWVPEWRLKQDTVPGTETRVRVTPNRIGTYPVICTELCGLGHSVMRARAVVLEPQAFDEWVRKQKEAAAGDGAGGGAQLFASQGCGSCHTLADAGTTGAIGPNLDESLQGKDAAFIEESIADPDAAIAEGYQPGVMPPDFGERLTDEQLDGLVEYLVGATSQGE
jgi:cytochrome c oxidase subunit 2